MSFPGAVTLGKFVYSTSYRPLWQVGGKYATHIINPHNLVVTALAIFWVCRDDKFMASRDFNLQGYNVIGVWVDRMDNIHLRHPASNQYEFQALSVGSGVGLRERKQRSVVPPVTHSIQCDCYWSAIWIGCGNCQQEIYQPGAMPSIPATIFLVLSMTLW